MSFLEFNEISYSYHYKYLGVSKSVALIPDGDKEIVNESNKREYVKLLCNYKMIKEIAPQTQSLIKGIKLGLTPKFFGILDWRQLGLHLAGKSKIEGFHHLFSYSVRIITFL